MEQKPRRKWKPTGNPVGRPAGREYGKRRTFAFSELDEARLAALAVKWGVTESEAVRRAIAEAAPPED